MAGNLGIEGLGQNILVDNLGGMGSKVIQNSEWNLATPAEETPSAKTGVTFTDMLRQAVDKTNEAQVQADQAIKETVAGRNKNIHETLLAVERADSSLKLMMQVRNKVLDAYREIMRMQV